MKKLILSASVLSSITALCATKRFCQDTENGSSHHQCLHQKDSEYANKMPLRAIENPQVYSSIDRIALENQLIFTVDDAYRNVTGLQKNVERDRTCR